MKRNGRTSRGQRRVQKLGKRRRDETTLGFKRRPSELFFSCSWLAGPCEVIALTIRCDASKDSLKAGFQPLSQLEKS